MPTRDLIETRFGQIMPQSSWPARVDWYDITLDSPAENLALDEALLNHVDQNPSRAILRTWEAPNYFVVVGRSNAVATEVNTEQCRAHHISIFRRSSGGGAVVIGPGCLAYALAMPLTDHLRTGGVTTATRAVMETIATGFEHLIPGISVRGVSDLVIRDRKISGNSERWLRNAFLHHGTVLYDFHLPLIQRYLNAPTRQPDYRSSRPHSDFVTNVTAPRDKLLNGLVATWNGTPSTCPPQILREAQSLTQSRYSRDEWNFER